MATKPLMMKLALALLLLLALSLAGTILLSGERETFEALRDGRRLVIDRETGAIQGKLVQAPAKDEANDSAKDEAIEVAAPAGADLPEVAAAPEAEKTTSPVELSSDADASPAEATPQTPDQPVTTTEAPKPDEDTAKLAEAIVAMPVLSSAPTITPSENPLPEVKPELTEKTEAGVLPAIGPDGLRAWKYYARKDDVKKSMPMIAIIVTGLGQNRIVTENALQLPGPVALAFSGYTRDAKGWNTAARLTSHEMLIELPLEPSNYPVNDPGPKGLLIEKGPQENEARLQWFMARFSGYVGFVLPANERFTTHSESFKILLQSIANRGLMVALSRAPVRQETQELVETSTTPLVVADLMLDEELSASAIQTRLALLEQTARKRGYAVGIAQPYPISIDQLRQWAKTLEEKEIQLVPLTHIVRQRYP